MGGIKNIVANVGIAMTLAGCVSQSSLNNLMNSRIYQDCTDEFMNASVERTFALPRERAPSLARDKSKLLGSWQKNMVMGVKNSDKSHRLVTTYSMSYADKLSLRGDGSYVLRRGTDTKERGGRWSYSGNLLVLTIEGEEVGYRLTWYSDDEFAVRMDDPMKNMVKPGVNAKRWYDDEGCLRMTVELGGDAVSQSVFSPEVFVRMPGKLQ